MTIFPAVLSNKYQLSIFLGIRFYHFMVLNYALRQSINQIEKKRRLNWGLGEDPISLLIR
jgi:hypothetical protein